MSTSPAWTASSSLASAALLSQVADALAWPLLLLRPNGGLLHANLAARRLLGRGQPLMLTAQRQVRPARTEDRTAFSEALQSTSTVPRLLHWLAPQGAVTATVSLLRAQDRADDSVLVALSPPGGHETDLDAFATAHALSEAETRVLRRLARGDSSTQAARALGVNPATVRSQTASLRAKTGHASVAALARALALLPPLVLAPQPHGGEGE